MRYVIVDIEATCWENQRAKNRAEIIEIGAVHLAAAQGPLDDEFARFVRPVAEPVLSDFCTRLTSIQQADVEGADEFPIVFGEFVDWIGAARFVLCSWGDYDVHQFRADCERHGVEFPASFERHLNLKRVFADVMGTRDRGMADALRLLGLPLRGTHHRGIDDARNIAEIAQVVLPQAEAAGLFDFA